MLSIRGLRSIVVFGSVTRGNARAGSDVDLLVVLEGFEPLGEAVDKLVNVEYSPRVWLMDEEWVWVLKPDAKIGEVIEL